MFKLKLFNYDMINEEKMIAQLNAQSEKDWNLYKVAGLLMLFKKENKRKYYYLNYEYEDLAFDKQLEEMGYKALGSYRKIRFYSSDEQLEPLHTDPVVKGTALLSLHHISGIIILLILSFMMFVVSTLIPFEFNIFNMLIHPIGLIYKALLLLLSFELFIGGVKEICTRKAIRKQMEEIPYSNTSIEVLRIIEYLILVMIVIVVILLGVLNFASSYWKVIGMGIGSIFLYFVLLTIYDVYFANKSDKYVRFLGVIIVAIAMVSIRTILDRDTNIQIEDKQIVTPASSTFEVWDVMEYPYLVGQVGIDDHNQEEIYVRTIYQQEEIIEGFKKRIIAFVTEPDRTLWNNYYLAEFRGEINGKSVNHIDSSQFLEVNEFNQVDHAYAYDNYWILQKDDEIVIVSHVKDIHMVVEHYFGE